MTKIIDRNEKDTIYVITPFVNVVLSTGKTIKEYRVYQYDEKNKPTKC